MAQRRALLSTRSAPMVGTARDTFYHFGAMPCAFVYPTAYAASNCVSFPCPLRAAN